MFGNCRRPRLTRSDVALLAGNAVIEEGLKLVPTVEGPPLEVASTCTA